MDVKTIFRYGELKERIYIKQPEDYIMEDQENKAFSQEVYLRA